MKTITCLISMAVLAIGCGGKKAGSGACGDAVAKGVDMMMAAGQKRMEGMPGGMPADMKVKMDDAATKLKAVITNRCTEDKWSAEIIDCHSKATSREELKACRAKLPPDQSAKLQSEEIAVMTQMMGGTPGRGMHGPGGPAGPAMAGSAQPTNPATPGQLDELNKKIIDASQAVANAKSDAERQAAQVRLEDLRKQAAALQPSAPQPSAH